jgi:hypothetical protein
MPPARTKDWTTKSKILFGSWFSFFFQPDLGDVRSIFFRGIEIKNQFSMFRDCIVFLGGARGTLYVEVS